MNNYLIGVTVIMILFLFWRFIFFLRNPERRSSAPENAILSPADGYVIYLKYISDSEDSEVFSVKNGKGIFLRDLMFLRGSDKDMRSGWLIGIAMTPVDVHYNRAPIEGFIEKTGHEFPRLLKKNFRMFEVFQDYLFDKEKPFQHYPYLVYNERASFLISNSHIKIYVTQIADRYVKKIVTYKDKEHIARGEVFGLIRMGSQVDMFIPDSILPVRIVATEGKHIRAGTDVVALFGINHHLNNPQ